MKRLLSACTLFVALSSSAFANDGHRSGWGCRLKFEGTAKGFQVLVGRFSFKGKGTLKCVDPTGERKELPVKIAIGSLPVAPRVSFGKMRVLGESAEVSLGQRQPEDLLGKYLVSHAQGAVVAGVGGFSAAHLDREGIAFALSVQALTGGGVNIGMSRMTLELDEEQTGSTNASN